MDFFLVRETYELFAYLFQIYKIPQIKIYRKHSSYCYKRLKYTRPTRDYAYQVRVRGKTKVAFEVRNKNLNN